MKFPLQKLIIFLLSLFIISLTFIPSCLAGKGNEPVYIDYDGDGLNDNIKDLNGDGIPDFGSPAESPTLEPAAASPSDSGLFVNLDGGYIPPVAESSPNSAKFGDRRFEARSVSVNRCSLDSEAGFGPGNGIGFGAVVSGLVCEGGVCHPR